MKLSTAQTKCLKGIRDWDDPYYGAHGRSEHGGRARVIMSLVTAECIEFSRGRQSYLLTDKGREALGKALGASPV